MIFVNIDHVIKTAKKHQCKAWVMWDSGGEKIDQQGSESCTLDISLEQLKESYEGVKGDYVRVQVSPKRMGKGGDQQSTVFKFHVECLEDKENTAAETKQRPGQFQQRQGNGSNELWQQLTDVRVMLAEQKAQAKIDALERELREEKAGGKNGKNKLLERYLTKILLDGEKKAPAAAIAGTQTPAAPAATADEKKAAAAQLVKTLQRFQKIDANYLQSLQKLAAFAESQPEQFKQYLQML
jgi:hypothetical protein